MDTARPASESTTTVFNEWYEPLTRRRWWAYRLAHPPLIPA